MKKLNSKYLGKEFEGWKVVEVTSTTGGHHIFKLQKTTLFKKQTIKVRDNLLTKLSNNLIKIDDVLKGKEFQLNKNLNVSANTLIVKHGLFLFNK